MRNNQLSEELIRATTVGVNGHHNDVPTVLVPTILGGSDALDPGDRRLGQRAAGEEVVLQAFTRVAVTECSAS